MSLPATMTLTPQATTTVAEGESTDASSEFWQRITGNACIVFENVPYSLAQNILQSTDPDTVIAQQLGAHTKRVVQLF